MKNCVLRTSDLGLSLVLLLVFAVSYEVAAAERPNILLPISDDQFLAHTSSTGCQAVDPSGKCSIFEVILAV